MIITNGIGTQKAYFIVLSEYILQYSRKIRIYIKEEQMRFQIEFKYLVLLNLKIEDIVKRY